MWTLIKSLRAGAISAAFRTLIGAAGLFAGLAATPGHAQPVEYVRICSLYGAAFFYIPGTDTCVNARQIVDNQFAIARANTRAATGTAMAASLVNPFLPNGTNFAVSMHWAGFDGQHAVGVSGLMRIAGNLSFSLGLAAGLDRGKLNTFTERTQTEQGTSTPAESWSQVRVLGRAGLNYAW
ncbi:MAG: porin [Xanthobacteraceae bacterium]|nr:porin [Xanthobacteraceae bacterium]